MLALAAYATIEMRRETSALADAARQEPGMYAILSDVRAAAYAEHGVVAALAICGFFWVALNWHRRAERAVLLLLKERKHDSGPADA
jgi:hypothetical protein